MKSSSFAQAFLIGTLATVNGEAQYQQPYQGYAPAPAPYRQAAPVRGPQWGTPPWRPRIGQRIQVVLDRGSIKIQPNRPLEPQSAEIWDLDLVETPKSTIDFLHSRGKRVLCYMSAGGSESWRPDFNKLPKSDLGDSMPKWKGEHYLNLRSPTVWRFMQGRIRMAYDKGCDGIDPDNLDPFNDDFDRGGGFKPPLTAEDSINYMKKFSAETQRYGMAVGMKNADQIIPNITDYIHFAVNEECSTYEGGCTQYGKMIEQGKPVFHFEYVAQTPSRYSGYAPTVKSVYAKWANLSSTEIIDYYCLRKDFGNKELIGPALGTKFDTAIKLMDLGGWVMYCDGSYAETPVNQKAYASKDGFEPRGGQKLGGKTDETSGNAAMVGGLAIGPSEEQEDNEGSRRPQQQASSANSGSRPWYDPLGWMSGSRQPAEEY